MLERIPRTLWHSATGDLYCSIMGQDVGFRSSTQPTEEWNKNNSNWYYYRLFGFFVIFKDLPPLSSASGGMRKSYYD